MNIPLQNELPGMIETKIMNYDEEIDDLMDRVHDMVEKNHELVIKIQKMLKQIRSQDFLVHYQLVHEYNQEILKVSSLESYCLTSN